MFLTDILFDSSHLRFSVKQKKAVLEWVSDLSTKEVPMLHANKTVQKRLNKTLGNPSKEKLSRRGNVYFINNIGTAIAKVLIFIGIVFFLLRHISES